MRTHDIIEHLNPAQFLARQSYRRINDSITEFFRDLGGVEQLPAAFDVTNEAWIETQERIDAAALAGEIEKTIELCKEYERRALAYFDRWRKKLENRKGVSV